MAQTVRPGLFWDVVFLAVGAGGLLYILLP